MKFIAHRGNLNGKIENLENNPEYIQFAIDEGFEAEVDIWLINKKLFLGHDAAQYEVNLKWIINRINKLWIHCKNINALLFFNCIKYKFNYFWHENDEVTLTSNGTIWAYPRKIEIPNSIVLLPEKFNTKIQKSIGICSDEIVKYKKVFVNKKSYT